MALPTRSAYSGTNAAATVAAPSALTSVVAAGAAPTKAEYDALRTDVSNLRTTVDALRTSLRNAGYVA